ncbi:hypothetical protein EDC96DRAFT_549862 [Choanephora cucurbitarum]|nr:hypothetical protein EDC96DRAFT_549862 [Choanephora cucurbitarum]
MIDAVNILFKSLQHKQPFLKLAEKLHTHFNHFATNQQRAANLDSFDNSFEFDKFGVIWFDKWLHEDTFGVITNTEIAFSTDKYYRPTLLLAIEQNFYTCVDYEVSEVIETEIGKILCE